MIGTIIRGSDTKLLLSN
uniref:Uncharacterized protein n=1 Tax=Anguilla anguilla TaxID=7936 RepID=A0A0E9U5V2_ANGAN